MFNLGGRYRIFIYDHGIDGRKSHNGLAVIVRQQIRQDLSNGDVFLFISRSRKVCKAVVFDGTGLLLFYKKLEKGRFLNPYELQDTLMISKSQMWSIFAGCQVILNIDLKPN